MKKAQTWLYERSGKWQELPDATIYFEEENTLADQLKQQGYEDHVADLGNPSSFGAAVFYASGDQPIHKGFAVVVSLWERGSGSGALCFQAWAQRTVVFGLWSVIHPTS